MGSFGDRGSSSLRILYHHRTRGEDAQGIHINALCEAFRELGHEVKIVALTVKGNEKNQNTNNKPIRQSNSILNLKIPHWFYEILAILYNIPSIFFIIISVLRFKPDFIYERYSLFTVSGLCIAKLFNLPFILEMNAPLSLEMKLYESLSFKKLAKWYEDWMCYKSTKTVVVSAAMRDIFLQQGFPVQKFMVIPNGVDPKYFHPKVNGDTIRKSLTLKNEFVVGFVGWMRKWHGIDILIDAIAILENKIPTLRLLLVGDGPAVAELKTKSKKLGVAEKIIFIGPVTKNLVPNYIAAMDVAVQPDVTAYASPIKLFEYLAMGKAIIAPRKQNIVEILEDGKHALLYSSQNEKELADKIEKLYLDIELKNSLSVEAVKLVKEKGFYWQSNANRIVEYIKQG